jgi:hypothetical protein
MTQFVSVLPDEHCFQYVERRYSGFVALRIVVAGNSGGRRLGNQGLTAFRHDNHCGAFLIAHGG